MEDLNTLLNLALKTENENYCNADGIKNCMTQFEKLSEKDNGALIIFLYFFPNYSPLENNKEAYWFIKYQNIQNYNEYNFAKDLLSCYIQYLSDLDYKDYERKLLDKIKLFKNYKLINTFLSVIEKYNESVIATISYIIKDHTYFKGAFELNINPKNIQTLAFINNLKNYLDHKQSLLDIEKELNMAKLYLEEFKETESSNEKDIIILKKKVNDLTESVNNIRNVNINLLNRISNLENENVNLKNTNVNLLDRVSNIEYENINFKNTNANLVDRVSNIEYENINLKNTNANLLDRVNNMEFEIEGRKKYNIEMDVKIQELYGKIINLEKQVNGMNERLNKIEIRDSLKMSRYLYKVLFSKYPNEMRIETKIWNQIDEVQKMLSKPQFKRFQFISEFLDILQFHNLEHFNHAAHDSSQDKRNFGNIKKYFQEYSQKDLKPVVEFFEQLPHIDKFINLNLLLFKEPEKIDEKFQENITYAEIYSKVFEASK